MIEQTISHYKILEKIGEGGMGEVYLAEDIELQRKVALKFLPPEYSSDLDVLARFKREARAAASLNHPNIITVHETAVHKGCPFIVMAYIDGASLTEAIAKKDLSLRKVMDIAVQVCDGLSSAHEAGVVHRDIKPSNVLIDKDGRVKILDFGLAKLRGASRLTKEASTLGTVNYMSPEQTRGEEVDHRSDIFSFGTVLYEMITGQLPFRGDHSAAVIYSITTETPQPLRRFNSKASDELERIVSKALAKDPGERYQSAADLAADLRKERRRLESGVAAGRSRLARQLIGAALVVVVAAVVVLWKLRPINVSPDQAVVAAENSLAVMYYENLVDPQDQERLGEIITNLLITDLSESPRLRVVSSQRLYDILKNLDMEGVKRIEISTATLVATKAGARWMLQGSILQVQPSIVVTSQLVEVASGDVVESQRIDGAPGESIFSMVDRMTVEVKQDLPLSIDIDEPEVAVADVTTHSTEAYRHYVEGVEYSNKYFMAEAQESFEKATKLDSTFAMAYYRLAKNVGLLNPTSQREYAEKAMKYAARATQRERHYIRSLYARINEDYAEAARELEDLIEKDPDDKLAYHELSGVYSGSSDLHKAIENAKKVMEIDPLYKTAYNRLAYYYDALGDLENSLLAINKYIELAPDEPNPYDTRADLYARSGRIDDAIASYQKALALKPDFESSQMGLVVMYVFKGEFDIVRMLAKQGLGLGEAEQRSIARLVLALIPMYQGKLREAFEILDEGIAADEVDGYKDWSHLHKYGCKASIYALRGQFPQAIEQVEKARSIVTAVTESNAFYIGTLELLRIKNGDLDEVEESLQAMEWQLASGGGLVKATYWHVKGVLELEKGNTEAALSHFAKATESDPPFWVRGDIACRYLQAGHLAEAVAEYDRLLTAYTAERAVNPIQAIRAYYYSGIAYEKSGWRDKAIERYEKFLDLWKDADPGIEEVEDAKRRLAALKGKTEM